MSNEQNAEQVSNQPNSAGGSPYFLGSMVVNVILLFILFFVVDVYKPSQVQEQELQMENQRADQRLEQARANSRRTTEMIERLKNLKTSIVPFGGGQYYVPAYPDSPGLEIEQFRYKDGHFRQIKPPVPVQVNGTTVGYHIFVDESAESGTSSLYVPVPTQLPTPISESEYRRINSQGN